MALNFEKIENERKARGMRQVDLAKKINMTVQGYQLLLKKRSMETKYLEVIAEVLQIPINEMFEKVATNSEAEGYVTSHQQKLQELNTEKDEIIKNLKFILDEKNKQLERLQK